MKIKSLLIASILSLSVVSSATNANILFPMTSEACVGLIGKWTGTGTTVTSVGNLNLTCYYALDGNIQATTGTNYRANVMLKLVNNSSKICPVQTNSNVQLSCDNTTKEINITYGNVAKLSGNLNADSTNLALEGTITTKIKGQTVTAMLQNTLLTKKI